MVVLMSPDAAKSQWVSNDISYALTSQRLADCVIPVFVKPTLSGPWILDELESVRTASNPSLAAEQVSGLLRRKLVGKAQLVAKLKRSPRGRTLAAKARETR